jgi:hypothetical protein
MVRNNGPLRVAVVLSLALLALTACSSNPQTDPTPTPTPKPSPAPIKSVAPTLDVTGSASKNLVVFENALTAAGAGTAGHSVADSISALVQAGFPIGAISYTSETSKIGEPSDSISLAVEFNGECLIGQFSQSWLATIVAPITDSGCLIGDVEKP